MTTVTRIDSSVVPVGADTQPRAASPLDGIGMSLHDRRQAEQDLRAAEHLVDLIVAMVDGCQSLVRRLRGVRIAH